MTNAITRVENAITALKQGKMVILTDDVNRENEADLIFPAELTTPEKINFMLRHTTGIICLSLTEEKLQQLELPLMLAPQYNTSARQTPFTLPIDAKHHITTGVSAADRAKTIQTAVHPFANKQDLVMPGHIFPLQAQEGGVLTRRGHTEGSIDLIKLAHFQPAAVLCELMNPDGTMMRGEALQLFAEQHQLPIIAIEDIIFYRRRYENLITDYTNATLPLRDYGEFNFSVFKEKFSPQEYVVLSKLPLIAGQPSLVRIHSSCMTGDIFHSQRCDCAEQLNYALQQISQQGGVVIYLPQEGRGIGLFDKIMAYRLQENGLDTIEANQQLGLPIDSRSYYFAAQLLRHFNLSNIRLLTNNPHKIADLENYGITVQREPLPAFLSIHNQAYLKAKQTKLHHLPPQ